LKKSYVRAFRKLEQDAERMLFNSTL